MTRGLACIGLSTALLFGGCEGLPGRLGALPDAGPRCGALALSNGAGARIGVGATANTEFTWEAWMRVTGSVDAPAGRLVGAESTGACDPANSVIRWEIDVSPSGLVTAVVPSTPLSTFVATGTGAQVQTGTWFHVALQYEGAGLFHLFVDGQLAQTHFSSALRDPLAPGCPLVLGRSDDGASARVGVEIAGIRHTEIGRYTAPFTPDATLLGDTSTDYVFEIGATDALPLTSNGVDLTSLGATVIAAGPDCP